MGVSHLDCAVMCRVSTDTAYLHHAGHKGVIQAMLFSSSSNRLFAAAGSSIMFWKAGQNASKDSS